MEAVEVVGENVRRFLYPLLLSILLRLFITLGILVLYVKFSFMEVKTLQLVKLEKKQNTLLGSSLFLESTEERSIKKTFIREKF